jgi:methanogenic corrinoid protein MtbC1
MWSFRSPAANPRRLTVETHLLTKIHPLRVTIGQGGAMMTTMSGPPSLLDDAGASDADLGEPFLQAILAGDQRQAFSIASEAQRHGMAHLYQGVARAMEEVGRLWQEGEISVADEHLATAVCEAAIASLYPQLAWPVAGPTAIVMCAAPERHQLGARMVADLLSLDGWWVDFLGGDVPLPAMVEMAVSRKPVLIGLSATLDQHLPATAAAVGDLRRALPGVRVLVGGRAVRMLPEPAFLGADAWASSCAEAVRVAAGWKRKR